MSSKSPKRQPAQSKTAQAEQARKRRNIILASLVAVAVVAVGAVLLAGGGGDDTKSGSSASSAKVAGVTETNELLKGIPQAGGAARREGRADHARRVRRPAVPVLQAVRAHDLPGDRQRLRAQGQGAGRVPHDDLHRARTPRRPRAPRPPPATQDREAYFTQLWYFNQGQENSGYATDEFIEKIWKAAGVDVAKAKTFADSDASLAPIDLAQKEAEKYGVVSTPTFLIGETGKPLTKFDVNLDDADAFAAAFDELLK